MIRIKTYIKLITVTLLLTALIVGAAFYYGTFNPNKKVIENKDEVHGVTVHFVDEGLDSGSIIGFIKLKVSTNEKENELENRIHKLEHYIYPKIISEFQEDKIRVEDNKVMIDKVFYENGKEYFN